MAQQMLTARQESILRAIVEDYIRTATPVSSEVLARDYDLRVSSATIRNDMAELEEQGYISQPHPSAGRMPTEAGYRYFVARLMEERHIPPSEQYAIRQQFAPVQLYPAEWIRLAAALLVQTVRTASIVSPPQAVACRVKHVELLQLQEHLGLLVVVLTDGTVKQQLVPLIRPFTQEALSTACNHLNMVLHGLTRQEIDALEQAYTPVEQYVLQALQRLMKQIDTTQRLELYHDGLVELLGMPEFARPDQARPLIEVLENPEVFWSAILTLPPGEGVQVLISPDGSPPWLRRSSLVWARYGRENEAWGIVGVLGPTRLPYTIAVPAVRFLAQVMSELLDELWGTA